MQNIALQLALNEIIRKLFIAVMSSVKFIALGWMFS